MVKNFNLIPVVVLLISGCAGSEKKPDDISVNVGNTVELELVTQKQQSIADFQSQIDPKAIDLLKQMSELLTSSNQFSFDALTLKEQVLPSGQKLQYDAKIHVDIKRPNAFIGKVNSGAKKKELFYNGKTLTLLDLKNNFYATTEAPDNIDDALDFIMDRYGVSIPLADFLFADVNNILTEHIQSGFYVALTQVNGKKAHHLAFTQDNVDWQIWINAEGEPSPIKFVINYKNKFGEPQFIAFFHEWNLSPSFKTNNFSFQPSKDLVEIEFIKADKH